MSVSAVAARKPMVLAEILPGAWARDILLIAGSACFVGLLAQIVIELPDNPVPITAQTFGVLFVGASLGWWRALAGMLLYAIAGAAGVPWFADNQSGIVWTRFGYVIGFILAATVVGWLAQRGEDRSIISAIGTMFFGTLLIYAVGVPTLAANLDMSLSKAITIGAVPFLLGDILKVLLAGIVLPGAWKLFGKIGK